MTSTSIAIKLHGITDKHQNLLRLIVFSSGILRDKQKAKSHETLASFRVSKERGWFNYKERLVWPAGCDRELAPAGPIQQLKSISLTLSRMMLFWLCQSPGASSCYVVQKRSCCLIQWARLILRTSCWSAAGIYTAVAVLCVVREDIPNLAIHIMRGGHYREKEAPVTEVTLKTSSSHRVI